MADDKADAARKADTPWREGHLRGQALARNLTTLEEREEEKREQRRSSLVGRLEMDAGKTSSAKWKAKIDGLGKRE